MINPNKFNGGNARVFIIGDSGEETLIGEAQSFKVNQEITTPEYEPVSIIGGRTISGILTSVNIDAKTLFNQLIQGANTGFDLEVKKLKAKTRKPRSKKKRIVKKWLKKNTVERTVYKGVEITDNWSGYDVSEEV